MSNDESNIDSDTAGGSSSSHYPPLPRTLRIFMRVSGVVAAILFLMPSMYGIKYMVFDGPRESRITRSFEALEKQSGQAARGSKFAELQARLQTVDDDQIPLLSHIIDADPDSALRKQAVITLGTILLKPGATIRRPFESLQGKAVLAGAASHDTDPDVKADAENAIDAVAAGGAVIRR